MLQQMAPLLAERGKLETLRGKAETKVLENQMALLAGDPDALRNMAKANAVNNPQLAAHLMAGKSFDEAAEAFLERPEIKLMEKELELKRDQMGFDRQIQAETMAINMQKMFPLAKYSLLKSYADSRLLGNQSAAMAYMSVISASPSAYALEAETEAAKAELATRQFEAQQEAALREYNLAVITMANEATQGQAKMFAELAFNPDVPSDQRDSAMEGLADALSRAGSIQVPIGDTAIRLGPDVVAKRFTDWWSILPGGSRFRGTRLELAPSAGEVERKEAGEAPEPTSELWQMFTYTEEEKKALKKLIPQLPLGAPSGFGLPL